MEFAIGPFILVGLGVVAPASDRSDPVSSCLRFLHAGSWSGGTLARSAISANPSELVRLAL